MEEALDLSFDRLLMMMMMMMTDSVSFIFTVCRIFRSSLTLCNTSSVLTRSVQTIFCILLQYHISKHINHIKIWRGQCTRYSDWGMGRTGEDPWLKLIGVWDGRVRIRASNPCMDNICFFSKTPMPDVRSNPSC